MENHLELENRRNARRISRLLNIRYVHQGGSIQAGSALDISETGARLVLDENESFPQELTVEFEGKLAMLARTVWEQPVAGKKRVVGVVFEGIHWGQRVALEDYLFDLEHRAA